MATSSTKSAKVKKAADPLTAQKVIEMLASLNLPVCDDGPAIEAAFKKNRDRYLRDQRNPDPAIQARAKGWFANVDALKRKRGELLDSG
jgi:hypothetical protein